MSSALLAEMQDLAGETEDLQAKAQADNTLRAYAADWADFTTWCGYFGLPSLPAAPETVALYITHLARREKRKISTLQRRLATISVRHREAELESPTRSLFVGRTMAGLRRELGVAPTPKEPARTEVLRRAVLALPPTVRGVRDRAVLLLGFAAALRRSELVGLDRTDVTFTADGLSVVIRSSKTDQEGAGARLGVPFGRFHDTCPVAAVRVWLDILETTDSAPPVFRGFFRGGRVRGTRLSDQEVAQIVKRAAAAAGLDPAQFAGHSLRAGLATSAAAGGAAERDIMKQTRHKSPEMVRRYIREGELFYAGNATRYTGL